MANILCVLYDDPASGYPPEHARDEIPKIEGYHDGQTTPTPEEIDFTRASCSGACRASLAYGAFSRSAGTNLIVTAYKDGPTPSSSRSSRRGDRDLTAVLARVPDR